MNLHINKYRGMAFPSGRESGAAQGAEQQQMNLTMNIPTVCPNCDAYTEVGAEDEAVVCKCCGKAFVVDSGVKHYYELQKEGKINRLYGRQGFYDFKQKQENNREQSNPNQQFVPGNNNQQNQQYMSGNNYQQNGQFAPQNNPAQNSQYAQNNEAPHRFVNRPEDLGGATGSYQNQSAGYGYQNRVIDNYWDPTRGNYQDGVNTPYGNGMNPSFRNGMSGSYQNDAYQNGNAGYGYQNQGYGYQNNIPQSATPGFNGAYQQPAYGANIASQTRICTNCGNVIGTNSRFCPRCGSMSEGMGASTGQGYYAGSGYANTQVNYDMAAYMLGKKKKSKWLAFFLCFFFGIFGAHKFYEGKTSKGILYIFTFGIFGIGWLIDLLVLLFGTPDPYYVD